MLGGIMFSSLGLSTGGAIGNLLSQLEQQGVFAYLLPFLMIFAVLFGILSKINIFGDNKGINVILSLVVALMSLQMNFVSYFFREIFPRMGVVLSMLLVAIILLGLFVNFDDPRTKKVFAWIVGFFVVIIVYLSLSSTSWLVGFGANWQISYWFQRNGTNLFIGILFIGALIAIISFSGKKKGNERTILEQLAGKPGK